MIGPFLECPQCGFITPAEGDVNHAPSDDTYASGSYHSAAAWAGNPTEGIPTEEPGAVWINGVPYYQRAPWVLTIYDP